MQTQKKISILSPCYNEEGNITELYERITAVLVKFPQYDYEIIIIDNCSKDNTADILRGIAENDKRVKVILNAKNFGPRRSGLFAHKFFTGECLICMASDLEDPPELIEDFIKHWESGSKVVMAVRSDSKEGFVMKQVRKLYYGIIKSISDVEQVKFFTGFGLYDRSILVPLFDSYYINTNIKNLIGEYGYDIAKVEFVKPVRKYGKSSYNFFSYFEVAVTAAITTSKFPIRLATLLGFVLSVLSLLFAMVLFVLRLLFWPQAPFGMAPLIIGMFFFASVQIMFLGLIGEYVAEILVRVSPKPFVSVREYINFDEEEKVPAGEGQNQ